MRRTLVSLATMMLLVASTAVASEEGAKEAAKGAGQQSEFLVSEAVLELLEAKGPDGAPIVGQKEREYFDALPNHAKELTADAVAADMISKPGHLRDLLALGLRTEKYELLMQNNCVLCHSDSEYQDPETLFSADPKGKGSAPYMNLASMINDVHFREGLSCGGCHGGDQTEWMDHQFPDEWLPDHDERVNDRTWVPAFCARCHSNAEYMREFSPSLRIDQFAKYKESRHGKRLLEMKDSRAAECVSCHGVHGIQDATSPLSKVNPKNIPFTCGHCHADAKRMEGIKRPDGSPMPTNQLEQYVTSVHGRALLERGDTGAAECASCHGDHGAVPAGAASVAQICRTCHARNGTLFDGSKHKKAFDAKGWPECGACHGNHAIAKTSDDMLSRREGAVCVACHAKFARDNPECNATAVYFHDTLSKMVTERDEYNEASRTLEERGVDVEAIRDDLQSLDDTIKQSRSYVHSFDRSDFAKVADPGLKTIEDMKGKLAKAREEFATRRKGLLVAMAMIGLLALAMYLKLRSHEKNQ